MTLTRRVQVRHITGTLSFWYTRRKPSGVRRRPVADTMGHRLPGGFAMPAGHYKRKSSPEERFWAMVDKAGPLWNGTPCWIWRGGIESNGYGVVVRDGHRKQAHRFTYETLGGSIPAGLTLDHLCRNHPCVNPHHLQPVTHRVNILRGQGLAAQEARRIRCPQGHLYDLLNTRIEDGGRRHCRACEAIRSKLRRGGLA